MHSISGVLRPAVIVPIKRHRIRSATIGWIALMVMILARSTSTAFGKQLTASFSPLSMLFLSECMLLLFAVLSFGFLPIVRSIRRIRSTLIPPLLIAGMLNGVLAPICWFTGLERTFAVNAQLFTNTEIIFLIAFGMLLMHAYPTRAQWFGGAIILLGILTVALHGFTGTFTLAGGDILIMIAGCCFALGGAFIRKYLRRVDPQIIIAARSCCAISFFFLLSPFTTHPFAAEMKAFPLEQLGVLIGYGLISRFLLVFSFYEAIRHLPLATVSLLGTVAVATGLLFSHWYLGESIVWYQSSGAALIVLGAVVVQWESLRSIEAYIAHRWKVRASC